MIRTLVSAALCTCILAAPASAGGSLSLSFHPTSPQDTRLLQTGIRLYALAEGIRDGRITQKGYGNKAGLAQNGRGNVGVVHQEGRGHDGTIQQNGNGNAYSLFQFGKKTSGHIVQNGSNRSGATFQFGW